MICRSAVTAIIASVSLLIVPGLATADRGVLRTAQSDEAPASVQDANPSKAEPMMIGPTPDQDAEAYRRDFLACDSHGIDARAACRDAVDREYSPDVTNLSGQCETLDAEAKASCLKRAAPAAR